MSDCLFRNGHSFVQINPTHHRQSITMPDFYDQPPLKRGYQFLPVEQLSRTKPCRVQTFSVQPSRGICPMIGILSLFVFKNIFFYEELRIVRER
jgi:hypothetical protein